jgi:hypothetical protein
VRLAVRIALMGVCAALLIGLSLAAFVAWSLYQASRPLDMAAVSQLAPVRSADLVVARRIDADAAALTRRAPWLANQSRTIADACTVTYVGDSFSVARNDVPWQCTRQVFEVFGVRGTIRARRAALAADLTSDGYATGSLQLVQPGLSEEWIADGVGQVDPGNLGAGGVPVGGLDLLVFWARRPAVLTIPLDRPVVIPPGLLDPVTRRAYARYSEVVIFFYADIYADGTGMSVSAAATPPPAYRVPCPGTPSGYNC